MATNPASRPPRNTRPQFIFPIFNSCVTPGASRLIFLGIEIYYLSSTAYAAFLACLPPFPSSRIIRFDKRGCQGAEFVQLINDAWIDAPIAITRGLRREVRPGGSISTSTEYEMDHLLTKRALSRQVALEMARTYPGSMSRGAKQIVKAGAKGKVEDYFAIEGCLKSIFDDIARAGV